MSTDTYIVKLSQTIELKSTVEARNYQEAITKATGAKECSYLRAGALLTVADGWNLNAVAGPTGRPLLSVEKT